MIVDSYKINTFSIKKKFEETLILVAQYLLPLLHYFSIFLEPSFFGWYYCDIIKAEKPNGFHFDTSENLWRRREKSLSFLYLFLF